MEDLVSDTCPVYVRQQDGSFIKTDVSEFSMALLNLMLLEGRLFYNSDMVGVENVAHLVDLMDKSYGIFKSTDFDKFEFIEPATLWDMPFKQLSDLIGAGVIFYIKVGKE